MIHQYPQTVSSQIVSASPNSAIIILNEHYGKQLVFLKDVLDQSLHPIIDQLQLQYQKIKKKTYAFFIAWILSIITFSIAVALLLNDKIAVGVVFALIGAFLFLFTFLCYAKDPLILKDQFQTTNTQFEFRDKYIYRLIQPIADENKLLLIPKKILKEGYYVICRYTLISGESNLTVVQKKHRIQMEEYIYQ